MYILADMISYLLAFPSSEEGKSCFPRKVILGLLLVCRSYAVELFVDANGKNRHLLSKLIRTDRKVSSSINLL